MLDFDNNTPHVSGRKAHLAVFWGWNRATDASLVITKIDDCCIDDDGYSPLHLACNWSPSGTAKKFVAHGGWKSAFDIDHKGWHPLHLLAKQDLEETACMILEILVSLPQTANDPDPEGHWILHSMIQLG